MGGLPRPGRHPLGDLRAEGADLLRGRDGADVHAAPEVQQQGIQHGAVPDLGHDGAPTGGRQPLGGAPADPGDAGGAAHGGAADGPADLLPPLRQGLPRQAERRQ